MNIPASIAMAYIALSKPVKRRGLYRLMRTVNRAFPRQASQVRRISLNNSVFSFPASDPFWLAKIASGKRYELEIYNFIMNLKEKPALFLDCGANIGYWSLIMSELAPTVAVEGSSATYEWLVRNNAANGERFKALHAAVSDGSVDTVHFATGGNHTGRGISDNGEKVRVRTIDGLVAEYLKTEGLVFVKLDVEGAEVPAFRGAAKTLTGRTIIVYEDHGKDHDCAPTAYLLGEGRQVFYIHENGQLEAISDLDQVRRIKVSASNGFDFAVFGDGVSEDMGADMLESKIKN